MSFWVMMIVVWAAVELIGFLRKKEFRNRLKSAALWSVVMASFATVGGMNPHQNAIAQMAVCVVMYGVVAYIVYFIRVKIFMLSQKKEETAS